MKKWIKYFVIFVFVASVFSAIVDGNTDNETDVSSETTSNMNLSQNNTSTTSPEEKESKSSKTSTPKETATPKPTENPSKKIDSILKVYNEEWEEDTAEELKSYNDEDVYNGICRAIKNEYKKNKKEIEKLKYDKIINYGNVESCNISSVNYGYLNIKNLIDLYLNFLEKDYKKDSLTEIQKITKKYNDNYDKYCEISSNYDGIYKFNELFNKYENAEIYDIYVDYLIGNTFGSKIERLLKSDKSFGYYAHDAVYNSFYEEYYGGDEEFVFKTYEKLPRSGYYQLYLIDTGEYWTVESSNGFERELAVYEELSSEQYEQLLKDKKALNKLKKDGKSIDSKMKTLVANL